MLINFKFNRRNARLAAGDSGNAITFITKTE